MCSYRGGSRREAVKNASVFLETGPRGKQNPPRQVVSSLPKLALPCLPERPHAAEGLQLPCEIGLGGQLGVL